MELVTGYGGKAHITPENWADLNRGFSGADSYVMGTGRKFETELISNNLLKIHDGCGIMQGRQVVIPKGRSDEVVIENGTQGMKRIDLIVERYTKNPDTKIETTETVIIKGTPSVNPAVPLHTEGDIRSGDMKADWPLYEVELSGLNIVAVKPLFKVLLDMSTINKDLLQLQAHHDKKMLTPTDLGLNTATWKTIANNSYKIGKTIHLNMEFYTTAVPSQYRPLIDTVVNVIASDGTYKNPVACTAMVKANGNLFICIPKATNNYLFIDAEWECA